MSHLNAQDAERLLKNAGKAVGGLSADENPFYRDNKGRPFARFDAIEVAGMAGGEGTVVTYYWRGMAFVAINHAGVLSTPPGKVFRLDGFTAKMAVAIKSS